MEDQRSSLQSTSHLPSSSSSQIRGPSLGESIPLHSSNNQKIQLNCVVWVLLKIDFFIKKVYSCLKKFEGVIRKRILLVQLFGIFYLSFHTKWYYGEIYTPMKILVEVHKKTNDSCSSFFKWRSCLFILNFLVKYWDTLRMFFLILCVISHFSFVRFIYYLKISSAWS